MTRQKSKSPHKHEYGYQKKGWLKEVKKEVKPEQSTMPVKIRKQLPRVNRAFLMYCPSCKHEHLMQNQPCPTCNTYETPQPVSEKVYDNCHADYSCDGCQAYREHEA